MELEVVCARLYVYSAVSDYYFPSWPWERGLGEGKEGLKKMDKQSDQKRPLRKREFSLRGKRERRGERREEARQGRVWVRKTISYSEPPVMTHKPALHT